MKTLTNEQQRQYVSDDGGRCPYCRSDQIEGNGGFDFEGGRVFQEVSCLDCNERWMDVYTLSNVIEVSE